MILVDSSIWIDHLHSGEAALTEALQGDRVLTHPFVIGELACGHLRSRETFLRDVQKLPSAPMANGDEVLIFIERHALMGRGLGYIDVHLLASTTLADGARLWTRDKRLDGVAARLGIQFTERRK
jgi:hypothetical protein